ncbi:MAG: tetratricopeptide repeat protein [candidate division NC10 bacterium]|nr:tetratricopeptide repeat protein [candidate division NC10 bacterium]
MMRSFRFWIVLSALLILGLGCSQSSSQVRKAQTADAYYKLGIFYLESGNYKQAISEFRKAVEMNPSESDYHLGMGTAYSLDGQDEEAIQWLKKAIKLNPDNSEAHNNLGLIYLKKQRWSEAISEFKAALANPEYGRAYSAHVNLAEAYRGEGNLDSSLQEYKKALDAKPDSEVAHTGLGRIYLLKGQTDAAIEEWEKSLKINERQIGLRYDLGVAYLAKGEKGKAEAAFKKVIESDPQSPWAAEAKKQLDALKR